MRRRGGHWPTNSSGRINTLRAPLAAGHPKRPRSSRLELTHNPLRSPTSAFRRVFERFVNTNSVAALWILSQVVAHKPSMPLRISTASRHGKDLRFVSFHSGASVTRPAEAGLAILPFRRMAIWPHAPSKSPSGR